MSQLNAISFTTSAIWCGFMTGNSVMLGLALARVCLGERREASFVIKDAQATTALVRLGDFSFWPGPQPNQSISEKSPVSQDPELGLSEPRRSSVDWADSGAPARVGTPVPQNKAGRLVVPSAPSGGSGSSPTETLNVQTPVVTISSPKDIDTKPEPTPEPAPLSLSRIRFDCIDIFSFSSSFLLYLFWSWHR